MIDSYQVLKYEELRQLTLELFRKIKSAGFIPRSTLGIATRGVHLAELLCDYFDVPIDFIGIKHYENIEKMRKEPSIETEPSYSYYMSVDFSRGFWFNVLREPLLVVDDVVRTGETVEKCKGFLSNKNIRNFKIATIFCDPKARVKPDFYVRMTEKFVLFPGEYTKFSRFMLKEKKTSEKELIELGIPEECVKIAMSE